MTHQIPAAVCSASGKCHGLRHYKRGVVAWKSDHSNGKTLHQAFLFPHRWVCRTESPHRVPKASHGGFVRHKADRHGALLVPHHSAREEAFLWMHGTHPSDTAGHQDVPSSDSSFKTSAVPPSGLGLGFPGSQRIKVAFCATSRRL